MVQSVRKRTEKKRKVSWEKKKAADPVLSGTWKTGSHGNESYGVDSVFEADDTAESSSRVANERGQNANTDDRRAEAGPAAEVT